MARAYALAGAGKDRRPIIEQAGIEQAGIRAE
jgi:hypothetical protein